MHPLSKAMVVSIVGFFFIASPEVSAGTLVSSPNPLNFGLVSVNSTPAASSIQITNTGSDTNVTGFSLGAGCTEFSVNTSGLPVVLGNGGSVFIDVGYDPVDRNSDSCQVTTLSSGTGGSFGLQGDGAAASLDLQTTMLNYANQRWNGGTPEILNILVANDGEESISLANLAVFLTTGSHFSLGTPAGFPIATGETGTIPVTFDPASAGFKVDTVTVSINNDSPLESNPTVSVSGNGTQSVQTFSTASLDIGSFTAGTGSGTANLGIGNSGTASLNLASVSITGDHAAEFALQDHGCTGQGPCVPSPAAIAPAGTAEQFSIRCSPAETGTRIATLEVASDDPQSPRTAGLQCTGTQLVELIFEDGFE